MELTTIDYAIVFIVMAVAAVAIREVWRSTTVPESGGEQITETDAEDLANWRPADERAAEQEATRRDVEGPDPSNADGSDGNADGNADADGNETTNADADGEDNRGGQQYDGMHSLAGERMHEGTLHPGGNRFEVAKVLSQSSVPLRARGVAEEIPELDQKQVSNALVSMRDDNDWTEVREVESHNVYVWALTNAGQSALERGFDLQANDADADADEANSIPIPDPLPLPSEAEIEAEAERLLAEFDEEAESDADDSGPEPANDDKTNWERAVDRYGLASDGEE